MLLFFLMNYCFFLECLSIAKQAQSTPEHPETSPEHSRTARNTPEQFSDGPDTPEQPQLQIIRKKLTKPIKKTKISSMNQ